MGVPYNSNWNRWIYASIVRHFTMEAANAAPPIPFYLDRYDRDVSWAELRFIGPFANELSRGNFLITMNVDIMVTAYINSDQYVIQRMTGVFAKAFESLCVYKYGDGFDDDQSLVGPLILKGNRINIINYGLILPENKFHRSTVASDFEMYLS